MFVIVFEKNYEDMIVLGRDNINFGLATILKIISVQLTLMTKVVSSDSNNFSKSKLQLYNGSNES